MAIDRGAVRKAITKGEGVDDQCYFVGFPFARQVKDLPQAKYWQYNIAEAKKLMQAYNGGAPIEAQWSHADVTAYSQEYLDTATLIQAQLKAINVNLTDNTQPYATYISTTYQGNYEGVGHSPRAVAYWLDYVTERFTMRPKRGRINLSYVNDPDLEVTCSISSAPSSRWKSACRPLSRSKNASPRCSTRSTSSTDTRTYFWDANIANYRPTAWFPYTHIMKAWRDA